MLTAISLLVLGAPPLAVDAKASLVYVQVYRDGEALFAGLSHDHVVRAGDLAGTVSYDPSAGECRAELVVSAKKLAADEPWLRERLHLPTNLDEGDRQAIKDNMLAKDQLDADRYPLLRITVSGCKVGSSPGSVKLALTLEIRGVPKQLEVTAELLASAGQVRVRGTFSARHTDFGFSPYRGALGAVRNRDELTFVFDVTAKGPVS